MINSREKKVRRDTLRQYAGMLGRNSLAYAALVEYDRLKALGAKVEIIMGNNGFALRVNGERANYGA